MKNLIMTDNSTILDSVDYERIVLNTDTEKIRFVLSTQKMEQLIENVMSKLVDSNIDLSNVTPQYDNVDDMINAILS